MPFSSLNLSSKSLLALTFLMMLRMLFLTSNSALLRKLKSLLKRRLSLSSAPSSVSLLNSRSMIPWLYYFLGLKLRSFVNSKRNTTVAMLSSLLRELLSTREPRTPELLRFTDLSMNSFFSLSFLYKHLMHLTYHHLSLEA